MFVVIQFFHQQYNYTVFFLIQVAHGSITGNHKIQEFFKSALLLKFPNLDVFGEGVLESVCKEFTQKLCHTRIQEFVSATKQQLATKKGLASTIDVNLRSTLLTNHTKLSTKLGTA